MIGSLIKFVLSTFAGLSWKDLGFGLAFGALVLLNLWVQSENDDLIRTLKQANEKIESLHQGSLQKDTSIMALQLQVLEQQAVLAKAQAAAAGRAEIVQKATSVPKNVGVADDETSRAVVRHINSAVHGGGK